MGMTGFDVANKGDAYDGRDDLPDLRIFWHKLKLIANDEFYTVEAMAA